MKNPKTYFLRCILGIALLVFSVNVNAQSFSGLDKSPHDIAYFRTGRNAPPLIKVIYGRPQLKGRSLGKELIPYGEVWRTGANEATEIRFYSDVTLGGTSVKAGTYTLFTIPGAKEWTIILNADTDVWGAFAYNKNRDVARINVPIKEGKEVLEAFSIAFATVEKGTHLVLGWGTVRIEIPIMI